MCVPPQLNNGRIDPGIGEECDDGNDDDDDACHNGARLVRSCADVRALDPTEPSGDYTVDVDLNGPLPPVRVTCDFDFDGGAWTRVFRSDGTSDSFSTYTVGDTSVAGSILSTPHIVALARRSQQVHIRTTDDTDRSATSRPGSLPIRRLRMGASLVPAVRNYDGEDWQGPFANRMRSVCQFMSPQNTVPDFFDACDDPGALQLFDDGGGFAGWEQNTPEPIDVWVGGGPACGDGVVNGNEVCDDGNAFDGDGCNNDCNASCGDGDVDVVAVAAGGFDAADAHAVDIDADGFDDLVIVERSDTPTLEVALGSARGLLPVVAVAQINLGGAFANGVSGSAIADVDGDDVLDVVLFRDGECGIAVVRGDGFGALSEAPQSRAVFDDNGACSRRGVLADVDVDGDLDVKFGQSEQLLRSFEQSAGATFFPAPDQPYPSLLRCVPPLLAAGDVVGAGFRDLLLACADELNGDPPKLVVFVDGNVDDFREVAPAFFVDDLVVADVDGDNFNDVVVSGAGGTQVLVSDGDILVPAPPSAIGGRVTVGDIDGDNQPEVLVGVAGGAPFQVLRIDGDGALSAEAAVGVSVGAGRTAAPAVLELDGDVGGRAALPRRRRRVVRPRRPRLRGLPDPLRRAPSHPDAAGRKK